MKRHSKYAIFASIYVSFVVTSCAHAPKAPVYKPTSHGTITGDWDKKASLADVTGVVTQSEDVMPDYSISAVFLSRSYLQVKAAQNGVDKDLTASAVQKQLARDLPKFTGSKDCFEITVSGWSAKDVAESSWKFDFEDSRGHRTPLFPTKTEGKSEAKASPDGRYTDGNWMLRCSKKSVSLELPFSIVGKNLVQPKWSEKKLTWPKMAQ